MLRHPSSQTPPPAPPGEAQGVPRPARGHSTSSMSWAVPWASSQLEAPDAFMRTIRTRHVMSLGTAELWPHPGARPGVRTRRWPDYSTRDPARSSPNKRPKTVPQWAHHLKGGTTSDRCKENWAADEGGDLDDTISRCFGHVMEH
ncbi:hypothetical protein ATANTOWER_019398 [Ataeniobius toweri]|uniref:Uncharacterized protein n=1 Tax=Ataeniobius toweri TaxID=208326 RepID=A0ABU7C0F1_9TELE|nr:hypothetical protein [Ataeniobius toweri]